MSICNEEQKISHVEERDQENHLRKKVFVQIVEDECCPARKLETDNIVNATEKGGGEGEGSQTKPSTRDNSRPLSILLFNLDNRDNVAIVLSGENINEKTLSM